MTGVSLLLAVAIWLAALHRVAQPGQSITKPAFIDDRPTDAHNLRCIALTAMVATLYIPPVAAGLDALLERPGAAATMMFALMVVGTGELLMALRCVALEPDRARAGRIGRGAALLGVIGSMELAWMLGQPTSSDVTLPWGSGGQLAWMAFYWAAWLAWCGSAGVRAGLISARYSRRVPGAITRNSLRFLTGGAVALATYAALKSVVVAQVVIGAETPAGLTVLTKLAVVAMGICAVGTSLWPVAARAWERRRFLSDIEVLTPLWRRLQPLSPGIALIEPKSGSGVTYDQARMRRYRMCLEIVDWWVLLARRLPQTAWSRALSATDGRPDRAAVAAAGWTTAGLAQTRDWPGRSSPTPTVPADVSAMQRFIVTIARVQAADSDRVADQVKQLSVEAVQ